MKPLLLPALSAALSVLLTGCNLMEAFRQMSPNPSDKPVIFSDIWQDERRERKAAAQRKAEREHLESFAADYAAWTRDFEALQKRSPEPPLPAAGAD